MSFQGFYLDYCTLCYLHKAKIFIPTHIDNWMYIVMELCQKETLHHKLRRFNQLNHLNLQRNTLLSWFQSVVSAVDYIHSKGHLHRDLKPLNVFFNKDGIVKVGDLGLAKDDAYATHTFAVGTLAYVSPEQLNGGRYTKSSDIFPLGIMTH